MGAVERLQAAVDKLETLKVAAHPGPWLAGFDDEDWDGVGVAFSLMASDAELIVILHRTIDAQLAILHEAVYALNDAAQISPASLSAEALRRINVIDLADAILGKDN